MGSFYGLWTRDGDGAFRVRRISNDYFEIGPVVKASRDGAALALGSVPDRCLDRCLIGAWYHTHVTFPSDEPQAAPSKALLPPSWRS